MTPRSSKAFTLIELLVVIVILSLLCALFLPCLGRARRTARAASTANALRQLLLGYSLYHHENNGALLYGYPPAYLAGQPLSVTLPTGQTLPAPGAFGGSLAILRYPARLAPYQHHVWSLMYNDSPMPNNPPRSSDTGPEASQKIYFLGLTPSFGLNSIFLGGDLSEAGFLGSAPFYTPNPAGPAAFRASDIRRPADQLVFCETKHRNLASGLTDTDEGFFRATPPMAHGRKWKAAPNHEPPFQILAPNDVGLPHSRWTARTVSAFFDGHVESVLPAELDDMRRWSPKAASPDYDYP